MITRLIKAVAMLFGSFWLAWVAYMAMFSHDALDGLDERVDSMTAKAQARQQQMMREERLANEGWGSTAGTGEPAEPGDAPKWHKEGDWGE